MQREQAAQVIIQGVQTVLGQQIDHLGGNVNLVDASKDSPEDQALEPAAIRDLFGEFQHLFLILANLLGGLHLLTLHGVVWLAPRSLSQVVVNDLLVLLEEQGVSLDLLRDLKELVFVISHFSLTVCVGHEPHGPLPDLPRALHELSHEQSIMHQVLLIRAPDLMHFRS